ncbi:MAG: spore coat associated protein CotJA [Eubacteriales bacterium]
MPNYRSNPNYSRNNAYQAPLDISYNTPTPSYYSRNNDENLADLPIAMAYVPWQKWENTFDTDKILSKGTLFPDLYKPFLGAGGYK